MVYDPVEATNLYDINLLPIKKNMFYSRCHGNVLHYPQSYSVTVMSLIGGARCNHGNVYPN